MASEEGEDVLLVYRVVVKEVEADVYEQSLSRIMLKWKVSTQQSSVDLNSSLSCSSSVDGSDGSDDSVIESFSSNLRAMVQDLQVGFTAAMTELSNIQGEDKKLYDKLNDSKVEQEEQMRDMLRLVQTLKEQCDNIQCQIEISNKNQRRMERQIKKLKSERRNGDDRQAVNGLASLSRQQTNGADSNGMYTSPMLKSFIASLPLPEEMEDIEDHHSDSDESLAEVTQKSLLLSNALAQRAYDESPQPNGENSNSSSEQGAQNPEYRKNGHNFEDKKLSNGLSTSLSRLQVQRQKTAMSIVDSERNYCTTLYNLIENYSKVLRQSDCLSARDCSRIFPSSLTSIYEYHCAVLSKLEMRLTRWRQQDILGDIFGKFADTKQVDIFAQYREYIENFTNALRTVRKLHKSSEKFRQTVGSCQNEAGGDNMSMISQLLAPVRRMPSLVLYIKKLLKYTDADHPDRYFLEASLSTFRSSLSSVNAAMERSIQKAQSDCNSSKRSLETSSWSSHEEEQRLSTATKDSGINSNCDLESHEELSTIHYRPRERNSLLKKSYVSTDSTDGQTVYREQPARPKSMVDFLRSDNEPTSVMMRRCKTPTIGMYSNQQSPTSYIEKPALKPSLSHSTPNLLDEPSYNTAATGSLRQSKTKHKVQFKNPPEEHSLRHQQNAAKRVKKRSIADTLRIIFNRRKAGQSKYSNSDMSDSCCDLNSSIDEAPQPAPPHMFASNGEPQLQREEADTYNGSDTYEDENGDPYSVV